MPGRRDIPPYEIMRLTGAAGPASSGPTPHRERGTTLGGRAREWVGSLTDRSPVVLRVPKGVALAAMAGVVLAVLGAYFFGHWRGGAAAEANWQGTREALGLRGDLSVPIRGGDDAPGAAETQDDPRTPGLNYLYLAPNEFDKASRFSAFLQARGYATMLVPARDPPLQHVVIVRGFPGDSVEDRRDRERFQQRIMQVAAEYQAAGGDRYDYAPLYDRYDPPQTIEKPSTPSPS